MVENLGKVYVTVVSGLPRSGTSMMMQMLAAGGVPVLTDGARKPDPDNPRGYFEFEPVKRTARDAGWLADAAGKAVKVAHVLLPDLPRGYEYRVLFMHRDMREALASQETMLRRHGRRGADLDLRRLAEVFASQLRRVREWAGGQAHFATLDVHYQQVIDEPAGQAARVNRFLDGRLDEAKAASIVEPALYRQRAGGRSGGR
jgi:hypothetical protein